jgi:hypothetical protein
MYFLPAYKASLFPRLRYRLRNQGLTCGNIVTGARYAVRYAIRATVSLVSHSYRIVRYQISMSDLHERPPSESVSRVSQTREGLTRGQAEETVKWPAGGGRMR